MGEDKEAMASARSDGIRGVLACEDGLGKAICLFVSALVSFAIVWALSLLAENAFGLVANVYQLIFFMAAIFSAMVFFVFRHDIKSKPENVFLCCVLTFTCASSVCYSVNEVSWDLDSHYWYMLEWSEPDRIVELSEADEAIVYRSESVVNTSIDAIDDRIAELDRFDDVQGDTSTTLHGLWRDIYKRISSLPASALYFFLTVLGLPFSFRFIAARIAYALIYSLVLYLGMRRLRSGKMIFAVVAFFPTMLFIASVYSYDYWVNAFVMMGVAYVVGALQRPGEKITLREAVLMIGAFVIGLGPKAIYFPMILLCLLVPRSSFASVTQSRVFRISVVGATLFVLASFAIPYFFVSGPGVGDLRGGSEVNSVEQIKFILANPIEYAGICLSFLGQYLSLPSSQGYIISYAYLGMCSPVVWAVILFIAAFATVTDKAPCDYSVNTWKSRTLVMALSFITLILVETSLYVSFTAVASPTVAGCQPRYILPLVFAFLVLIGPRSWSLSAKISRTPLYNGLILAVMVLLNYIGLWQVYIGLLH